MRDEQSLPLAGVKVIEFTHMVMGPAVGLVLADMGADVIKLEPVHGDKTRGLPGSGAGYFPAYNRNKRSLCVDLKSPGERAAVLRLVDGADVLVENFRPGTMDRLGFRYEALKERNKGLIDCSEKGFLAGPNDARAVRSVGHECQCVECGLVEKQFIFEVARNEIAIIQLPRCRI